MKPTPSVFRAPTWKGSEIGSISFTIKVGGEPADMAVGDEAGGEAASLQPPAVSTVYCTVCEMA